ncbi:Maf-like protein [Endozoicomonas sp. Mp262]|uniref:Maf family protein n=1 Tax=Endozoicomonas sp. Mp262 TaxID=2919499 RepID=UPI0021D93CA7
MKLVLASSSKYRQQLLKKLGLPFQCHSPNIDETPKPEESARVLSTRLAREKAFAIARLYPEHLIIASDQSAQLGNTLLGKPGNKERAIKQLTRCSGNKVTFYTALVLLNSKSQQCHTECIPFHVHFKTLTQEQISGYVEKDNPVDCAGSFKCEGLGIALFEKLEGDDPNTLIGLPLITLNTMLAKEGIDPLLL